MYIQLNRDTHPDASSISSSTTTQLVYQSHMYMYIHTHWIKPINQFVTRMISSSVSSSTSGVVTVSSTSPKIMFRCRSNACRGGLWGVEQDIYGSSPSPFTFDLGGGVAVLAALAVEPCSHAWIRSIQPLRQADARGRAGNPRCHRYPHAASSESIDRSTQ